MDSWWSHGRVASLRWETKLLKWQEFSDPTQTHSRSKTLDRTLILNSGLSFIGNKIEFLMYMGMTLCLRVLFENEGTEEQLMEYVW